MPKLPRDVQVDDEQELPDDAGSPEPFWSGTISFGLVSIPVNLYPAHRSKNFRLRMLASDGTPLRRQYYSSKSDRKLAPDEMVRGFEMEDGRYVVVTDEELERLAPEMSRDIDLRLFVKQDEIPQIYFERAYFLIPENGSAKAYQLLAAIMEKTRRAGIATLVMRGKEYLVAILSENRILQAETMRFADELRSPADIGLPDKSKHDSRLVSHFERIISKNSAKELSADELRDRSAEQLTVLVEKKISRHKDVVKTDQAAADEPKVIDILEVLKQSLAPDAARPQKRPPKGVRENDASRSSRADISKAG